MKAEHYVKLCKAEMSTRMIKWTVVYHDIFGLVKNNDDVDLVK